jgi:lysylphosphatidylglycerol synthetase-like protein (DUF2156 family)
LPTLTGDRVIEEPHRVIEWLRQHSRHPLSLLLRNVGARVFVDASGGGVGFIEAGRSALCIGGVVPGTQPALATLEQFLKWCDDRGLKARFVHITGEDAAKLEKCGFRVEQIGASYQSRFALASLEGKQFRQVRRKLSNARRAGVTVEEVRDEGRFAELAPMFAEINSQWLGAKRAKPLRHMVCAFDLVRPGADDRVFVAWHGGQMVAYLVFTRTLRRDGQIWFHNLSRRLTGCVDGTMQVIVAKFLEENAPCTLHFGFTPLVEMQPPQFVHSRLFSRITGWLSARGGIVYPARAQRQYKMSWAPDTITPEYFAYRENTLSAALGLLRTTNSI